MPHPSQHRKLQRTAVVTGAGSGIGRACAVALLQRDWRVALLGRQRSTLEATLQQAGAAPSQGWVLPCDVSDEAHVTTTFSDVQHQFGRLDLLFNNAGGGLGAQLPDEVSGDAWRQVVDVNLNGAFYCLREAFRLMRHQQPQGGRIINNGSLSATTPRPGSIAYTATKHAVNGLTKAAALDGRAFQIAVGQIDIGNAATDLTLGLSQGAQQPDGSRRPEPRLDLDAVVATFIAMAELPLSANVLFATVMATGMPFLGRG